MGHALHFYLSKQYSALLKMAGVRFSHVGRTPYILSCLRILDIEGTNILASAPNQGCTQPLLLITEFANNTVESETNSSKETRQNNRCTKLQSPTNNGIYQMGNLISVTFPKLLISTFRNHKFINGTYNKFYL